MYAYQSIPKPAKTDVISSSNNVKSSSSSSSKGLFITTFKSTVGSGFFALPFAFSQSGLGAGLLVVVVVIFFTSYTTKQLVHSAEILMKDRMVQGEIGFADLSAHAFGGRTFVTKSLLFSAQYIACCTYMVFLQSTLPPVLLKYIDVSSDDLVENCCLLFFVAVELVLALAPNPSFLERVANFGNLAFLLSIIFILINGFTHFPPNVDNLVEFQSIKGMYICFGIACFTLSAHAECLSIFSTMENPNRSIYDWIIDSVLVVASGFYVLIAIFGYACFGEDTHQIILSNFLYHGGILGDLLQVCLCAMICCNYPLTIYPVYQMFESKTRKRSVISKEQMILRYSLIILSGAVAYFTGRQFGMISTIGGACIGIVAFVLPPLFYINLHGGWTNQTLMTNVVNLCILFVGFFASIKSLIHGIEGLV